MKQLLLELNAPKDMREWCGDKSWQEIYNTCDRSDWLLWLFKRTNPQDLYLITVAKARCGYVMYLSITDKISKKALNGSLEFGADTLRKNELSRHKEVNAAHQHIADCIAHDYMDAAVKDAAFAICASESDIRTLTAELARKYLPIEKWNINI